MKKSIAILSIILITLSFVGCSSPSKNEEITNKKTVVEKKAEPTVEVIRIKTPAGIKDTGKGRIEIDTPSGNSNDGVVPFIYADKETVLTQIGLNAWEFDGAKLSYIFVDGILNFKDQLGDTQTSITLKENDLKIGNHTVEVTQYDNDKMDGKISTYKLDSYEVKAK
ncbi:MAG: hypothetical protein ACREVX_06220 [Clostridium sp.]|uniref:hypothetical protein n=1 Tax=Clostridium sp. TaxID=1506 RepID=UPI003D6D84BE